MNDISAVNEPLAVDDASVDNDPPLVHRARVCTV